MNKVIAASATALLVSLGWAGFGPGAGLAQADCNSPGQDHRACPPRGPNQWCPGQDMGANRGGPGQVAWDMNVCHTWYYVGYGQGNTRWSYDHTSPPGRSHDSDVWDGPNPPAPPAPQCGVPGKLPCWIGP
jgi:hypothetical protein